MPQAAPGDGGDRSGRRDAGAEVLDAVHRRTARAMFRLALWVGTPAVAAASYVGAFRRTPTFSLLAGGMLFVLEIVLLGLAARKASRPLMFAISLISAGIPVAGFFSLGPGFGSSAGFVAAGCLAAVFVGRPAAVALFCGVAALLVAFGLSARQGDLVGVEGLWTVPVGLYVSAALATVAWLGVALVVVSTVFRGLTEATGELFLALSREREERARVKVLAGLIPICMDCRQVRNDRGYWDRIEEFIASHSEAHFTHGICPGCFARRFPNEAPSAEPPSRDRGS